MYPNIPSGITLAKVLSGVNKSLNIAREIIPIYQTISPMIGNARKAFSMLKELNISPKNSGSAAPSNTNDNKKTTNIVSSNSNLPSFFQ